MPPRIQDHGPELEDYHLPTPHPEIDSDFANDGEALEELPASKMERKMAARRSAEDWWEDRRLQDDDWETDRQIHRKIRRGKNWRSRADY